MGSPSGEIHFGNLEKEVESYKAKAAKINRKIIVDEGIIIHFDFYYLTIQDLERIFRLYKDAVLDILTEKTGKRIRVHKIPVEVVHARTGNSIDILFFLDPHLFVEVNKKVVEILADMNISKPLDVVDWISRALAIAEIVRRMKAKVEEKGLPKNIGPLEIRKYEKKNKKE